MFKLPDLALGAVGYFCIVAVLVRWIPQTVPDYWVSSGLTVDPVCHCGIRLCRGHVTWWLLDQLDPSLFELDRDTLHTGLGSAHECHSGVRLCAFALVSLMPVGLTLHGPWVDRCCFGRYPLRTTCFYNSSHAQLLLLFCRATGFSCCAFRGSGSRQGRRELEPYPTDRARGTLLQHCISTDAFDASYTGKIPLYTADLSACPEERDIRGVTPSYNQR
uniref:Uncharacterized protein n=1 Tax=Ananas comosus var. bracteatus TaxID=296719 RepID=A0A6V7PVE4_ANACO|nr:unnamed protein product [Ananas comosus var. bracteatus]